MSKDFLNEKTIAIIKATAPVVAPRAKEITTTFYRTMFTNNPEALAFFNKSHQKNGAQPQTLANAVVAYASNIDNLGALGGAVEKIAHRHCALSITANLYPIVHDNLMIAIGEVLGDAVTPEIGEGWSNAVNGLGEILINAEEALYKEAEQRSGGWRLERDFVLVNKTVLGPDIVQFEFAPADGNTGENGFDFSAGQYLTLRLPGLPNVAPRHYTVTSEAGAKTFQCVTRLVPGGDMSTFMHSADFVEGAAVQMGAPYGVFVPEMLGEGSVAFLTAGSGVTTAVALLKHLHSAGQQDRIKGAYHVDRSEAHDTFRDEFKKYGVQATTLYTGSEGHGAHAKNVTDFVQKTGSDTHYVMCGPMAFMYETHGLLCRLGCTNVHYEVFGTGDLIKGGCPVEAKA